MTMSACQITFTVGTVTCITSIIAVVLAAVITQGVYCDNARSYCNLSMVDDVYTWYFVNKSNVNYANCIYHGDLNLSENAWQIVSCFDNSNVNNTNINNNQLNPSYDMQICPQSYCGKWYISAGLFNTAKWLFIIGGSVISTILSLVVCCYLGKKIKQRCTSRGQSQQFNYHNITVVVDDFGRAQGVHSDDSYYSSLCNNSVNKDMYGGNMNNSTGTNNMDNNTGINNMNPDVGDDTVDIIPSTSPIAIYVENT